MNSYHHLDSSTLIGYSAGSLPEAFRAVVSAHLSICAHCRTQLLDADRVGGQLMSQQEGVPLPAAARDSLLKRLAQSPVSSPAHREAPPRVHDPDRLPEPLWPYFGRSYSGLRWRTIGPGVHHIRSQVRDGNLMLLRIAPGRSVPMHSHGGNELTMILQGAYDDSLGHFAPGDVADLDCDIEHQPATSPGVPCVCVAATDLPLRFSGWLARALQPLFKM
ncbi:ChrR family anti-sigma-E factor [Luteibacter yeojuensis]|uniref:Transcriptional regulator n=1 Tax=Luteibacter yeojuensis TaxID=345309 RepID=A0A7X5QUY0_9GAMM|nr:ChrR family anti-sigma-E factor [Luteibacter yeojuensis]NID15877.1 transcriptional regulator [Luteibacter yeojuensis]